MLRMSLRRSLRNSSRPHTSPEIALSPGKTAAKSNASPKLEVGDSQAKKRTRKTPVPESASLLDPPSTPPRKRTRVETPSPKKNLQGSAPSSNERENQVLAERPAQPHRTNATLKTPGGSRLVPYSKEIVDSSPIRSGMLQPTTTTAQILDQACAHLIAVDPRLKPLIEKHHCRIFSPEGLSEEVDPFEALCSGIMSQQVSGAAAKSIKNKFIGLFNQDPSEGESSTPASRLFPKTSQIVSCSIPFLRTAGLSERKAEYIQGLAEKFESGELSAKMLIKASDEEVLEKLVAVRGLGRWSVEMFACFGLKRMDVLSTGDLGVQ